MYKDFDMPLFTCHLEYQCQLYCCFVINMIVYVIYFGTFTAFIYLYWFSFDADPFKLIFMAVHLDMSILLMRVSNAIIK